VEASRRLYLHAHESWAEIGHEVVKRAVEERLKTG
jgi:hypothetical protein